MFPLLPRDGCWLDLYPDEPCTENCRQNKLKPLVIGFAFVGLLLSISMLLMCLLACPSEHCSNNVCLWNTISAVYGLVAGVFAHCYIRKNDPIKRKSIIYVFFFVFWVLFPLGQLPEDIIGEAHISVLLRRSVWSILLYCAQRLTFGRSSIYLMLLNLATFALWGCVTLWLSFPNLSEDATLLNVNSHYRSRNYISAVCVLMCWALPATSNLQNLTRQISNACPSQIVPEAGAYGKRTLCSLAAVVPCDSDGDNRHSAVQEICGVVPSVSDTGNGAQAIHQPGQPASLQTESDVTVKVGTGDVEQHSGERSIPEKFAEGHPPSEHVRSCRRYATWPKATADTLNMFTPVSSGIESPIEHTDGRDETKHSHSEAQSAPSSNVVTTELQAANARLAACHYVSGLTYTLLLQSSAETQQREFQAQFAAFQEHAERVMREVRRESREHYAAELRKYKNRCRLQEFQGHDQHPWGRSQLNVIAESIEENLEEAGGALSHEAHSGIIASRIEEDRSSSHNERPTPSSSTIDGLWLLAAYDTTMINQSFCSLEIEGLHAMDGCGIMHSLERSTDIRAVFEDGESGEVYIDGDCLVRIIRTGTLRYERWQLP